MDSSPVFPFLKYSTNSGRKSSFCSSFFYAFSMAQPVIRRRLNALNQMRDSVATGFEPIALVFLPVVFLSILDKSKTWLSFNG
jgi:hypothetical protein